MLKHHGRVQRAGLKRVTLPKPNMKDVEDLPEHVSNALESISVERIGEVLSAVMQALPTTGAFAGP